MTSIITETLTFLFTPAIFFARTLSLQVLANVAACSYFYYGSHHPLYFKVLAPAPLFTLINVVMSTLLLISTFFIYPISLVVYHIFTKSWAVSTEGLFVFELNGFVAYTRGAYSFVMNLLLSKVMGYPTIVTEDESLMSRLYGVAMSTNQFTMIDEKLPYKTDGIYLKDAELEYGPLDDSFPNISLMYVSKSKGTPTYSIESRNSEPYVSSYTVGDTKLVTYNRGELSKGYLMTDEIKYSSIGGYTKCVTLKGMNINYFVKWLNSTENQKSSIDRNNTRLLGIYDQVLVNGSKLFVGDKKEVFNCFDGNRTYVIYHDNTVDNNNLGPSYEAVPVGDIYSKSDFYYPSLNEDGETYSMELGSQIDSIEYIGEIPWLNSITSVSEGEVWWDSVTFSSVISSVRNNWALNVAIGILSNLKPY